MVFKNEHVFVDSCLENGCEMVVRSFGPSLSSSQGSATRFENFAEFRFRSALKKKIIITDWWF